MYYGKGKDTPRARASDPVKELFGGSSRLFLQSNQHLDQHQAFNTATIQTQESVHPAEQETEKCTYWKYVFVSDIFFITQTNNNHWKFHPVFKLLVWE